MDYFHDVADRPRQVGEPMSHAVKLKQHLHDQMLAGSELCDVTLIFSGVEMKAHWCVLVTCPYFQSLYNSGLKEKQQGKVHISVGKVAAIRQSITFLYTGQLQLDYSQVKDILEVADYLQIDDLKAECTRFLSTVPITVDNCVHICLLASLYDLSIYTDVCKYMRGHLPQVLQQAEMLDLTTESIIDMVKDPVLSYVERADLFKFIVKWVKCDKDNRAQYFDEMFCELDLKKMSKEFLENEVEACEFVSRSDKCKVHVLNVKMKHLAGLLPTDNLCDVMLLVGGMVTGVHSMSYFLPMLDMSSLTQPTSAIYAYILAENRWAQLAPLPCDMKNPAVAYKQSSKCLYVYDRESSINIEEKMAFIHKYDLAEKTWSTVHLQLPPFKYLTIHEVLVVNGRECLLASAGTENKDGLRLATGKVCLILVTGEMTHSYDVSDVTKRNLKTGVHSCVVQDRYLCILCTKTGAVSNKRNTQKFFVYDMHTCELKEQMRNFTKAGAIVDPIIYAVKNVVYLTKQGSYKYKKFDFETCRWMSGHELLLPLSFSHKEIPSISDFMAASHDDRLYVFGGRDKKKPVNAASVCEYPSLEWTPIEPVPKPVYGGAVVPAKIPNSCVNCHLDCPHCSYSSVRSQTSYTDVELPEEDYEDEEDDYYSYDEDDMYSDFWNNDIEDEMDLYPWF